MKLKIYLNKFMNFLRSGKHRIQVAILLTILLAISWEVLAGNIPQRVVHFAWDNIYEVGSTQGSGSGFWVGDNSFLTACHVISNPIVTYERNPKSGEMDKIEDVRYAENITVTDSSGFISFPMELVHCDQKTDLALLKPTSGLWGNNSPKIELYTGWVPAGTEIWGAGYPMGMGLTWTHGFWNGIRDDKSWFYRFTLDTMFGDSGSPVIAKIEGKWYVVAMRQMIKGNQFAPIAHLSSGVDADIMRDFLKEHDF